jgi:transaldolase
MKATEALHNLGQSIWLDNITRDLLDSGTLKRYIDEWSVTGLTSNPTIFDQAIKNSNAYDTAIREKLSKGKSGETLFFDLALEDITRAAALFRPIHDQTDGVDGWVSLEVSPLLAYDTASSLTAARGLHARAGQPNLFIRFPALKKACPPLRRRSSPAFQSTSLSCSLVSSISLPPTRFCAAWNGASNWGFRPMWDRWLRCLSAVGMWR